MIGIALGTLAAPALVGLFGAQGAFLAAGCFLPLAALASYTVLRRLDAGTAVPVDVLELLMKVPTLAVLAPRIVERWRATPSRYRCRRGRASSGRTTSGPAST